MEDPITNIRGKIRTSFEIFDPILCLYILRKDLFYSDWLVVFIKLLHLMIIPNESKSKIKKKIFMFPCKYTICIIFMRKFSKKGIIKRIPGWNIEFCKCIIFIWIFQPVACSRAFLGPPQCRQSTPDYSKQSSSKWNLLNTGAWNIVWSFTIIAFLWLQATFKNLLRHYAERTLTHNATTHMVS